jgi:hypothetical protein
VSTGQTDEASAAVIMDELEGITEPDKETLREELKKCSQFLSLPDFSPLLTFSSFTDMIPFNPSFFRPILSKHETNGSAFCLCGFGRYEPLYSTSSTA